MRILNVALCAFVAGSFAAVASGAVAAPVSPGLGAPEGNALMLITDYGDDMECSDCGGYDEPPYQAPKQKKPSKTDQFLKALEEAARQAAEAQRERQRQKAIRDEEKRRQKAIRDEEKRQQRAAENERRKREAAAEKKRAREKAAAEAERKRKAAAVEAERKRKAAAAEADRKKRAADAEKDREKRQTEAEQKKKDDAAKAAADEAAPDPEQTADSAPRCDGKTCAAGEFLDGDCHCQVGLEEGGTETTTLDGVPIDVVIGPTDELPAPTDLPDPVCLLKIGKTTLYCDGYLPTLPPTKDTCRGRTEKGCYLRTVNVPGLKGESVPTCMQFCDTKRPPPVKTAKPVTPKPKKPEVATKTPGIPAVKTVTATIYVEPKPKSTPAVKTAAATPFVEPKRVATPAVKTATATSYVEPKPSPTPAVNTTIAATVVEPTGRQ